MKKGNLKKLRLDRETLAALERDDLGGVAGGQAGTLPTSPLCQRPFSRLLGMVCNTTSLPVTGISGAGNQ